MQKSFIDQIRATFSDPALLTTALTHRSFLNENRTVKEHNERLEFLGDAVLELVTTEFLYQKMPDMPEGTLTSIRAALVRKDNLDKTARALDIGTHLLLSKGEDAGGGRTNPYLLANAVEAIIGAIYLDQGMPAAKQFIETHVLITLDEIIEKHLYQDAKSRLQEIAQERHKITPSYQMLSSVGPDHEKTFTAGVFFDSDLQGQGIGKSKQTAELKAAEDALVKLGW